MVTFEEMGAALRSFLEIFRKGNREEIRKRGNAVLQLIHQMKQPHLEKDARAFAMHLGQYFSDPENQELAQRVLKSALHLEQETREI